jgi:AAA family ATP:ADP antiporter
MAKLGGLLDVRPDERRNTFASFASLLVLTSGHTLLETARDALFLTKLPASELPWMYLVIAVLALGAARLHLPANKSAIAGTIVVGAGITAGLWVYGHSIHWSASWLLYVLYIWSGLFASWVTTQIWTLLGRAHTMTQAKRLYGFIGAGAVIGGVLGAFAARGLLMLVSPGRLVVTSAIVFVATCIPLFAVRVPDAMKQPSAEPSEAAKGSITTNATLLASDIFARRILILVFTATLAVTLADFLFKARVAEAYQSDTRALAAWLSTFYAITNTIALVAQLVVGPWVFRTFGVQRALFFTPVLLLGAASTVLFTGGSLIAAVLLKSLDGSLRYSVHRTSMELLLVPIPDGTRERVKPIIELVGNRGGQAFASLAILGLVAMHSSNTTTIGAVTVLVLVFWLTNVITIRGNYLDVFRETLRTGGLSGKAEIPDLDLGALELLFAGLNSSYDQEVLASLDLLAEQHRENLIPALILYHPSREVVLRALELFTHRGRTDFVSIADRLNKHPDRTVAAAALRARTAVAPDRKLLEERIDDDCAQVAVTALVALMARQWIDGAEFDRRMKAAIETRSWSTAAEIARAIRDISTAGVAEEPRAVAERFDDLLIRLAREARKFHADDVPAEGPGGIPEARSMPQLEVPIDARVRLEVATAMCTRKRPAYLPVLVGMLNRHELRAAARDAIAAIPGAVDFVDEVLTHSELARDVRTHLPRTIAMFEPEVAAKKLLAHLTTEKDGAVRFKILRALVKLRRNQPRLALDDELLRYSVTKTLDHLEELRRWRVGLKSMHEGSVPPPSAVKLDPMQAAHHLLLDLVRDKERHGTQRLFMLLDLLYKEDFEDIERGLRSKKPKTRASSLELVENIVQPVFRTRVLDLVGDEKPAIEAPTYQDVLREMLARGGSTMRTLAEYRAVELGIDPSTVAGRRSIEPKSIESLGKRLVDKAIELLPEPTPGATRAPA